MATRKYFGVSNIANTTSQTDELLFDIDTVSSNDGINIKFIYGSESNKKEKEIFIPKSKPIIHYIVSMYYVLPNTYPAPKLLQVPDFITHYNIYTGKFVKIVNNSGALEWTPIIYGLVSSIKELEPYWPAPNSILYKQDISIIGIYESGNLIKIEKILYNNPYPISWGENE